MRVIVLRKQFVEDTSTTTETEQTTSSTGPEKTSKPKPIFLHIILSAGLIETKELGELLKVVEEHVPPGGVEPVIISGRLPVWAFSALTDYFHARPWVATFDPRYGAGVVSVTHSPEVMKGDLVPADKDSVTIIEIVFPPKS